jgi:putative ABC transport system permease protein
MAQSANSIASALGSHDVAELDSTSATLVHAAAGRNYSGPLYVATPSLLRAFGIRPSQVDPAADALTMRPGLAGVSQMQLVYGNYYAGNGPGPASFSCPASDCLAGPVIQDISTLPSGTSAPNTVLTEHAVRELGLGTFVSGWLIQAPHALTAAQVNSARLTAAAASLTIETRSGAPSSSQITSWATAFGIALALGILAMTVGLIRSEAASDLRTLAATGASAWTRRAITAATAGALGLLGALLGTLAGYVGIIAWIRSDTADGGISALRSGIPVVDLLVILVGMPVAAAVGGWLLSGREPPAIARRPLG